MIIYAQIFSAQRRSPHNKQQTTTHTHALARTHTYENTPVVRIAGGSSLLLFPEDHENGTHYRGIPVVARNNVVGLEW